MSDTETTILIVDDEAHIRKMLSIFLETTGYRIVESESGKDGLRMATSARPDLILLDLGLPDIDGKEVIRQVREWSHRMRIIVLSVRDADEEIAQALSLGADDYVTKPFSADVLLARIKANLRKTGGEDAGEPEIVNGDIRMDLMRHEVFLGGEKVTMTPKEYDLLRYFLMNRGRMLVHKQILKEVWGPSHGQNTQYLRVYVSQLREKLEADPAHPVYIVTEPGIGYRMESREPTQPLAA
jgi:two-component system KDP operon response regulator KdpE